MEVEGAMVVWAEREVEAIASQVASTAQIRRQNILNRYLRMKKADYRIRGLDYKIER